MSMVITERFGVSFSSKVLVYAPKSDLIREVVVPSLDEGMFGLSELISKASVELITG